MMEEKTKKNWAITFAKWTLILLIGVALGAAAFNMRKLMVLTGTSVRDVVSPPFEGKRFFRVLVLGEDNTSRGRNNHRGLSDTIMVAAVDLDQKTVRAISIPRDSRVEIPGHGFCKINSANVYGGPEFVREVVQGILGVPIDYYILTDISGLKNIVDLVGGVGIEVEKDMRYTDKRGGLYINLKKGYRHLNGEQALGYVRFRHDALGDITRMQRQQKFLRALARQVVAPANWTRLNQIVSEVYSKGYVETNLNGRDMLELARLARDVPQEKVETATAPGLPQNIDGASYFIINEEELAQLVRVMLDKLPDNVAKVEVLNGSGIAGLGKEAAEHLRLSGYIVMAVGNADSQDYENTQVLVHRSHKGEVEIARLLGSTKVIFDDKRESMVDITVIVGRDYVKLKDRTQ